ncbi:unnamed protein product [Heligmosomoides polygyrus]|uniref:Transposase n=1 Tax=Heligmosomoides polygyrus TaxID=6339 RepID=A0A183G2J7_HELPZ|nr:unnamed protein product [Heligmosomoides polygyrus]
MRKQGDRWMERALEWIEGHQAPSWETSSKVVRYLRGTAEPTGISVGDESSCSTTSPSSNGNNILDDDVRQRNEFKPYCGPLDQ